MRKIVKKVGHISLEGGFGIIEAKGHDVGCEGTPWCSNTWFVIIQMVDLDLV